jgi:hypothetical protein
VSGVDIKREDRDFIVLGRKVHRIFLNTSDLIPLEVNGGSSVAVKATTVW